MSQMTTEDEDLEEYGLAEERVDKPAPAHFAHVRWPNNATEDPSFALGKPTNTLDPSRPFGVGVTWPTRNVGITLPKPPGRALTFEEIERLARET